MNITAEIKYAFYKMYYFLLKIKQRFTVIKKMFGSVQSRKKGVLVFVVLLAVVGSAVHFYLNAMEKATVTIASASFPSVTRYDTPDTLSLSFQNAADTQNRNYKKQMNAPIAPIDSIGKEVETGITLSPAISGTWKWSTEKMLTFTPKQDWPADQEFVIRLEQRLFDPNANSLEENVVEWVTPPFKGSITNMSLEQDVAGGRDHNIYATMKFSHPVDKETLEKNLQLLDTANAVRIPFELNYEPNLKTVYLRSHTVDISDKEHYVTLHLGEDVRTTLGKAHLEEAQESKKLIPDIYSFLKLNRATYSIIENEQGEPEQIFHLSFTDAIDYQELERHLSLEPHLTWDPDAGFPNKLVQSSKLKILPISGTAAKEFFLKSEYPVSGWVAITLKKGMKSVNGFELRRDVTEKRSIPSYPTELKIMGEGSLLALSGEKRLSFAVRGISGLKVTVQKLQDDQINHLISQTRGTITSPSFKNYTFNADNITDKQLEEIIPLANTHPKERNYASLDLTKYLKNRGSGIFFVRVEDYNIQTRTRDRHLSDKRLIVVTDLGMVVKKAADGSRDVFVESIASGKPVSGAKVSVLGKNGQAVISRNSSVDGALHFPDLKSFEHAQEPTVIIARKGNDLSFIPYDGFNREISYSRFDVGGIRGSDTDTSRELSAYAFSDRGIYRPGETVHLAAIVRQGNFELEKGTVVRVKVQDARQKLALKQDVVLDRSGFFEIDLPTTLVSPTGRYGFNVYLPVRTSSGYEREHFLGNSSFSVEEFQPDTMKIKTHFEPLPVGGWVGIEGLKTKVKLTNLFGLPAQNRKIKAQGRVTPTQFHFGKYADYSFRLPHLDAKVRRQETLAFNEIKTDANGSASFDVALPYDSGMFRVDFEAEGFEPDGGRSVRAKATTLVSDAPYLVGYKTDGGLSYLKKGQDRSVTFIAVDPKLDAVPLDGLKLDVIYNEKVSVLTKQRDGRYRYETVIKKQPRSSTPFTVSAKGTKLRLDTEHGGDYTMNLTGADGKLLASIDYYIATKSNMTGALEKNAELTVKLDKGTYKPGEAIELNIVAPYVGTGLITIESDRVHAHRWFKTDTKSSIQTITLPGGLEGNAYVNVTFVRSIGSREIFTSPLSYAVAPFRINSEKRRIAVDLSVPERVKPGEKLTIGYKADRKAKIVVYAVDEGILQVAKYTLPDPVRHFLKKRALDVETYQMLDLILPEFSRYVENAGIGGGAMEAAKRALGANLNPFQRTRDKPAVFWSGIVDAGTDMRELDFVVPDAFSGSLKIMAVAVSDEAMGAAAAKTIVRGPFVLSPNVLTMAAPNDTFDVTVGVSNAIEGSGKNTPVEIGISLSDNLTLLSEPKGVKAISEGDEDKMTFRVKAGDALGEGVITFSAGSGTHFQKRRATLSIRPSQNYATTVTAGYEKENVLIDSGRTLYPALASKTVSASNSPFVLATGLTDYLASYPHGCTEQIVSQTFPWVALSRSSKFGDAGLDARVRAVIAMLQTRQLGDGGFGLWPSSSSTHTFASLYAMHFLTELKGLSMVDASTRSLYEGGMDFLRKIARVQTSDISEARRRALAIYLLIRNEEVATNYLVDLHNELKKQGGEWQKDILSTYMAASYMLLKKQDAAEKLIDTFDPSYASGYTDFQSNLTMNAQYIYLIATHFPERELDVNANIMPLLKPLMEGKLNTVSASFTVLALSAYSQNNEAKYGADALEFFAVGKERTPLKKSALTPFMKADVPLDAPQVAVTSQAPLFYQLVQSGYDKKQHAEAFAQGIEVFKEYVDRNGTIVSEVKQGDELEVRIKVRTLERSYVPNVVLIDLLPGGFEVIRESVPRNNGGWRSDYVDIREDRVVFYAGFSNSMTELRYRVKATAAGTFVIPSASAASMYDPDIQSHTAASTMTVTPADAI